MQRTSWAGSRSNSGQSLPLALNLHELSLDQRFPVLQQISSKCDDLASKTLLMAQGVVDFFVSLERQDFIGFEKRLLR